MIVLETVLASLNKSFIEMSERYNSVNKILIENTLLNRMETDLDDVSFKFDAAKKALQLVNSLSPGQTKLRHTRRVMKNLSILRTAIGELEKKIEKMLSVR